VFSITRDIETGEICHYKMQKNAGPT